MGRILIIDDELSFRRVISDTLRKKGHEIYQAGNTAEGLRLALELRPDVIIRDVCMEGGDGLTLLKTVRSNEQTSTIPFLVMTGRPDYDGMLTGAEFAADGYLPKPFRLETLLATVEKRLNREKVLRNKADAVKQQLQRILEASPDLIGILDPKTLHFIFLNAAGRTLIGIGADEDVTNLSIDDLHHSDRSSQTRTVAIPAALSSGIWAGENVLSSRDNRQIPVKQFFQAHLEETGSVAFISTIAHDLRETKEAEAALRASEAKFRRVLDSLPNGVIVHNSAGKILFHNARTEELFGYSGEDLDQLGIGAMLPEAVLESLARTESRCQFETLCRRKNGEELPVDLVADHVEMNGQPARLNILRDLTERKKLERERQNIEFQLHQALKLESIGQLAAGIAHEINSPTQYIGDNTRFLQDAFAAFLKLLPVYENLLGAARTGTLTAELIAHAEKARAEADLTYLTAEIPLAISQTLEGVDRVSHLVRAMKDFSHPGTRETTFSNLNHLIESTITVARNEWKYVAEVETEFDSNLPHVPCLPGEFNQVILNIIVNAAHAIEDVVGDGSRGKGKIRIITRKAPPWAEVRISDTGTGIPAQVRPKVFDPFFTTKDVGKGTGQGLAISRSVIVDKHGGTIDFESEPGRGTTFIIRLPLNSPFQQAAA